MPNPDNMDDGNGGPDVANGQVQMPFNFDYSAIAAVSEGSTKGEAMGSKQWNVTVSVSIIDPIFAKEVKLFNYPNPFTGRTTISYQIQQPSQVQLAVFDMKGQPVATLVNNRQGAGTHEVDWGTHLSGWRNLFLPDPG